MENRHLCRGKRIDNGEWVEGYLSYPFCTKKDNESYCFYAKDSLGFYCRCVVDAATICQCTGLKDKNGKLIWENDIMEGHLDEEHPEDVTRTRVLWHENGWRTKESGSIDYEPLDDFDSENFEVIGNKFDNPELLEE
ncbi:YopX family protein [Lachnospiraceae bacterium SGI.085]